MEQPSSFRGPLEFFEFLATDAGLQALYRVESKYDVVIRVKNEQEVLVHPIPLLSDVERELKTDWFDYDFNKTMRIKLLSDVFQSAVLHYPPHKAAMVLYRRSMIMRNARLVELMIERNGQILLFGSLDGLSVARGIIEGLTNSRDTYSSNSYTSQLRDTTTVERSHSTTKALPAVSHPMAASSSPNTDRRQGGAEASSSTQSLLVRVMVKSADAPRLIGSRGVNKRRIEQHTQCKITLHTESRKEGIFPVEIIGRTMEKCLAAKQYIKDYLASEEKQVIVEEKKRLEPPKIHLEMTPRSKLRKSEGGDRKCKEEDFPALT